MVVAQTTRPVQKNRLRDEATVRTDTVDGGGKREKEGKETSMREQPGRTGAREEREAAEKRQERSNFTCRGKILTLKEEKEKREESGESGAILRRQRLARPTA